MTDWEKDTLKILNGDNCGLKGYDVDSKNCGEYDDFCPCPALALLIIKSEIKKAFNDLDDLCYTDKITDEETKRVLKSRGIE